MDLRTSLSGIQDGMRRVDAVASSLAGPQIRGGSSLDAHRPPVQESEGAVASSFIRTKGIDASVRAQAADSVDISSQAVEMLSAENQVGVNAAALGRAADTEQSVLDMLG